MPDETAPDAVAHVTNLDGSEPERGPDGMIAAAPAVWPEGFVPGSIAPATPGEPGEANVAGPTGWKKVRFAAPADVNLPVEYAGRWWHANTEYVLPAAEVAALADVRGMVVLGDAPEPAPEEEPRRG